MLDGRSRRPIEATVARCSRSARSRSDSEVGAIANSSSYTPSLNSRCTSNPAGRTRAAWRSLWRGLGDEALDPVLTRQRCEVLQEEGAHAVALEGIRHGERHLGVGRLGGEPLVLAEGDDRRPAWTTRPSRSAWSTCTKAVEQRGAEVWHRREVAHVRSPRRAHRGTRRWHRRRRARPGARGRRGRWQARRRRPTVGVQPRQTAHREAARRPSARP